MKKLTTVLSTTLFAAGASSARDGAEYGEL